MVLRPAPGLSSILHFTTALLFMESLVCCSCGSHGPDASIRSTDTTSAEGATAMSNTKTFPAKEEGFAKVSRGEGETYAEGIIDAKGTEVVPPRTSFLVNDITGHTALIQNGRLFQFVDLSKGPVNASYFQTAKGYDYAEPFRCGRAMVQQNDRRSYIDTLGNALFQEDYDFAETFHNDRAMVMQAGKYRIINTDGKTVAAMHYDQVNPQSPWCWQVTRIKGSTYWSGFVDLDGKEITPLIYDEVGYYDPEVERIRVGKGDRYGFLDAHAREVIKVQYEAAEIFDHGKARVVLNGREFFIEKDGNEVPE